MTFTEHTVTSGEIDLYVRAYGDPDSPLLIALHGWPDSSRGWSKVAPLLAAERRVIVPDQRGFGRSGAPIGTENYRMGRIFEDLAAIADWAGAESFDLAGHDLGAAVTWAAGMFVPQRVNRAVAMAAPHPLRMHSVAGNWRQLMLSAYTFLMNVGEEGEALLRADDFSLIDRFAFGSNPAISAEDRAAYKAEWSQPGRFTAMAEWYRAHYRPSLLNPDVAMELPKVTVPTRYIHGTNDFAFVEELAETNEPFMDAAYDHVLVDTTHWMLYERPEEMAELILDWVTNH